MKNKQSQPTTRRYFSCFFSADESITHQNYTNNGKTQINNRGSK